MSAFSNSVCVYLMHMYQHARSKSFISCILVFNTENDCLPSSGFPFFFSFLVNYVKVLELYWLLTILKNKTKLFELYYRGWHCSGMGQSFLQSFSYHLMILVQELEIFLFIPWYFTSALHSMSMEPSGTKWQNKIKWYLWHLTIWSTLGVFRWRFHWASLKPEIKFCAICEPIKLCFDQIFSYVLFLD